MGQKKRSLLLRDTHLLQIRQVWVNDQERDVAAGGLEDMGRPAKRSVTFKVWAWIGGIALVGAIAFGVAIAIVAKRAEPILRKRVIETLEAKFKSPVELDQFHITFAKGLGVEGKGLRIMYIMEPNAQGLERTEPMLSIDRFDFHTDLHGLLRTPTHVSEVRVTGMHIRRPPKEERKQKLLTKSKHQSKETIVVDRIVVDNTDLVMETNKPGKDPLDFEIHHLVLVNVGAQRPLDFTATLVNPKPVGDIATKGHFGPWNGDDPHNTPLDGTYSFTQADLNTIKGIGGMLSSTGSFGGTLDYITADGTTDTPNFSLDVSEHEMDLKTKFHAVIDGTNGDVLLQPVEAWLGQSYFVCTGHVVRVQGVKGKDIQLDVVMPKARIEDMLRLGVKTSPPLMSGALTMRTKLHIPPGDERVAKKMTLHDGTFTIKNAMFSNSKIQERIDSLSMRAQGRPHEANAKGTANFNIASDMKGKFDLGHQELDVKDLVYELPGAQVLMQGQYTLDGAKFEFAGKVRTKATVSEMTTGWKSILLKPVDRFFKKDGAGTVIPVKISGVKNEPHFGLDFKDEKTKDLGKGMAPPK